MRVGEACTRSVVVTAPEADIEEAAKLMREYHVGALVVVKHNGEAVRPVGIVTDRDLVIEVLAAGVPARELTVGDVMSDDVVVVREDEDLDDALEVMRARGIRRVPVVSGHGELSGILAIDDVLELVADLMGRIPLLVREQQLIEAEHRS